VDPEARHAHKSRSVQRDGYKAHIVAEPETGLVTAASLTKAAGTGSSDPDAGQELLESEPALAGGTGYQVLGDSAYARGELLEHLETAGHEALVKPKPLRPAVTGGFTLDDFAHDEDKRTMTCPNGVVRKITCQRQRELRLRLQGLPAAGPVHRGEERAQAHHHRTPRPPTSTPRSGP
jgi:hypothetical protein